MDGELKVTQKVVTVLFQCLDTLEQMINNISDGVEDKVPIEGIIEELESIANGEKLADNKEEVAADSVKNDVKESAGKETSVRIPLNEYDINVIKQAIDKGFNVYDIKVTLDEDTLLKSARAF